MTPTNQVFILDKEPLIRTTLRLLLATTDNFVLTGEALVFAGEAILSKT